MGDAASGWQKVLPTARSRVANLDETKEELYKYERRVLDSWARLDGGWSGHGKHTTDAEAKNLHGKLKPTVDHKLGSGGQGSVVRLKYTHRNQSVVLARKQLKKGTLEDMRKEADILENLCHDHVVKLVGTYTYHFRALYLILWPAATCDLAELLNDMNNLRFDEEDREDILERLARMELVDTRAIDNAHAAGSFHDFHNDRDPLNYLQHILGCLTSAVHYCHTSRVRHLDLKPENVLVSPGRVYLADFGISRDVKDVEHTMTFVEIGSMSWLAPERDPNAAEALAALLAPPSKLHPMSSKQDGWSMKAADIYSLGLVFLNIATILYGAPQPKLFHILKSRNWRGKLEQLDEYLLELRSQALVTQVFADDSAHTCSPRHVLGLIESMLSLEPTKRPTTAKINEELVSLGGIEQVYHNSCCKVPARMLNRLLDRRYTQVFDERARLERENKRLQNELQVLKAAKETVESRLKNQKEKHDKDWQNLVKQLEIEKSYRHQLETNRRVWPGGPPTERGGTRKPPRPPPPQQHGRPGISFARAKPPRAASPKPAERPSPDMRKSSDSLNTFMLHTQSSWSRVRPPVKPTTPSRSATPITPGTQESTLTNTTDNSMSSSILSRGTRRTASSGLSSNPSPCSSRILSESNRTIGSGGGTVGPSSSYFQGAASQAGNAPPVTPGADNLHYSISEHGSIHESDSQQAPADTDLADSTKAAFAKSWAIIAGDQHGLSGLIGAADAAGKKKKKM